MESLLNLTIEETYEFADAILDNDMQEIKEQINNSKPVGLRLQWATDALGRARTRAAQIESA